MRVSGNQYTRSRDIKAVGFVNQENQCKRPYNHSTKSNVHTNFTFYKYTNLYNGKEIFLLRDQLLKLGREFVNFTRDNSCILLKQTFWNARGITYETAKYWCERESEFKQLFDLACENIGNTRERLLQKDPTHIRSRQALYVPEYKEFDQEMIKLKAQINKTTNDEGQLSPEQIQEIIRQTLEPVKSLNKQTVGQ
jgi:hypothetical protein